MKIITLLGLLLLCANCQSYNHSLLMENYPTPFTEHNRVIGFLLAFNFYHIDPIIYILNEYTSMCEAGWDTTLVFFTALHWSPAMIRYMKQKSFCYRSQKSIGILVSEHDPSIGIGLGAQHRTYMGDILDDYDVFIYHEDDILFKLSHLNAYLYETKKLHQLLPDGGLWDNTIGFQRYRRLFRGNDFNMRYGEQDVFEQELLEETPEFSPICIKGEPYIHVQGNTHQAVWVFTRQQVLMLQEKCSFLNQSSPSRYFQFFLIVVTFNLNKL